MFEDTAIEITCPNCGKNAKEKIGRLKRDPHFTCSCGQTFDASEFVRSLGEVDKTVDEFRRNIQRLNKKR